MPMYMVEGAANRTSADECFVVSEEVGLSLFGNDRAPGVFAMKNHCLVIASNPRAHRVAAILAITGDVDD